MRTEENFVQPKTGKVRPVLVGTAVLAAALAVELVDELAGGVKSAALPLIRRDLGLSYGQIGLLESAPLLLGSIMELPLGILAGRGRRRRRAVLIGGAAFILTLAGAAVARSFAALLAAFILFFPASGAFVGLTQSGLMDADPGRREHHMARWELAGSAGALAGPVLVIAVLAAGGGWRPAYLALAAAAAVAWAGVARNPPAAAPARRPASDGPADMAAPASPSPGTAAPASPPAGTAAPTSPPPGTAAVRPAPRTSRSPFTALRQPGVIRWLVLLQVSDLLLDVFTGFLALYLVAVAHASPAQAALAVAIRLGAGLAGDAALIRALNHVSGLVLLRVSAAVCAVLFPAFLLAGGLVPKLLLLGCLSLATAPWYPVLQAELYGSLPDSSGVVVSLSSAAGLLGGAVPLAVGLLAQRFGLAWALACLAIAPPLLLAGLRRPRGRAGQQTMPPPSGDGGGIAD
jgi:MFS transporter, FSR family, fosmidomycin resistance protein